MNPKPLLVAVLALGGFTTCITPDFFKKMQGTSQPQQQEQVQERIQPDQPRTVERYLLPGEPRSLPSEAFGRSRSQITLENTQTYSFKYQAFDVKATVYDAESKSLFNASKIVYDCRSKDGLTRLVIEDSARDGFLTADPESEFLVVDPRGDQLPDKYSYETKVFYRNLIGVEQVVDQFIKFDETDGTIKIKIQDIEISAPLSSEIYSIVSKKKKAIEQTLELKEGLDYLLSRYSAEKQNRQPGKIPPKDMESNFSSGYKDL